MNYKYTVEEYTEFMQSEKTKPTWLETYWDLICQEKIIVGHEMREQISMLVEDLGNNEYYYDTKEARERILFAETASLQSKAPYYGKPLKLLVWQKCLIEVIYSFKMADTGFNRFQEVLIMLSRKGGKLLKCDTPIPTPDGWKKIKDIHIGDYVFDVDGKPTLVTNESEIANDHKCYELTFEDDEKIIAADTHLWAVQTKGTRRNLKYVRSSNKKRPTDGRIDEYGYEILETKDMVNDYFRLRKDGKGTEYKYRVPMNKPVEYTEKNLIVDPYLLGYWLGNGTIDQPEMTVSDEDVEFIVNESEKRVGLINVKQEKRRKAKRVRIGQRIGRHNTFKEGLKKIGVSNNKHIPDDYLYSSIEQRYELLKGICDSDGHSTPRGMIEITQSEGHLELLKQISTLLYSLGIKHNINKKKAKCNGKEYGAYRLFFFVDKEHTCFKLDRKTKNLKEKLASRMGNKSIINIKEIEPVECKCISVANKRGLFLCGNNYTCTHNSTLLAADILYDLFIGEGGNDIAIASFDEKTAKLIFDEVVKMSNKIDRKEKIVHSTIVTITNKRNNTVAFRLSSKSKGLDGRNLAKFVVDEAHLNPDNSLAMAGKLSMSVRDNPLMIVITTNGFVDGYLDEELEKSRAILNKEAENNRRLSFLFTQDSENEIWQNELSWYKANPSLGIVKKWDYLRNNVNDAKMMKSIRSHVLTKDFNIKQNSAEAFLMPTDYMYEQEKFSLEDFRGCYCFGAVDLSFSTDLSCAKILIQKPNNPKKYIFTKYFIPSAKLDNTDDIAAGAKYREWAKNGFVDIHDDNGGNEVNLSKIAEWFYLLYKNYGIKLYKLGYDIKFAKDFLNTMDIYGYGSGKDQTCEMITQNKYVMSTPIKAVEADLKSQLIQGINDMDKWCFGNAALQVDNEGRVMLVKISQPARIDGIVTQCILQAIYSRYKTDYINYINKS